MQKTFLQIKSFRWALPIALVTVMAIGCGSAEEPAEEVAPVEVSSSPDTATLVPDTANSPIDTSAGGKPPVNRQ